MLLAARGVHVNQSLTSDGSTALILAAQNGHTECVRALIGCADVDVNHTRTDDDSTSLTHAAVVCCIRVMCVPCRIHNDTHMCIPHMYPACLVVCSALFTVSTMPCVLCYHLAGIALALWTARCQPMHVLTPGDCHAVSAMQPPTFCQNGHTACVRALASCARVDINQADLDGAPVHNAARYYMYIYIYIAARRPLSYALTVYCCVCIFMFVYVYITYFSTALCCEHPLPCAACVKCIIRSDSCSVVSGANYGLHGSTFCHQNGTTLPP